MRNIKRVLWMALVISMCVRLADAQELTAPKDTKDIEKRHSAEAINGKTLYEWTTDLRDKDASVRLKAVGALKAYGSAAREAMPALLNALHDKDTSIRVNACITIGFIGIDEKDKPTAIPLISALLNDHEGIVRFQAIQTLAGLGSSANSAVLRLAYLTKDQASLEIRRAACAALGKAGYTSQGLDNRAFNALLGALHDPVSEVRHSAVFSLMLLGRPASPAEKTREELALQTLFKDKREMVAVWAHATFMRINTVDEKHLTAIAKSLKSPKSEARIQACMALATIGVEAKSKVDDIMNCLDDKDPLVQTWAVIALGYMDKAGGRAIPTLRRLASTSTNDNVKRAASEAVSRLGG